MDQASFDRLVMSLGTSSSRRATLGALVAGLLAPLLREVPSEARRKRQHDRKKGRGNGPRRGRARDQVVAAVCLPPGAGPCSSDADCCGPHVCLNGLCSRQTGRCAAGLKHCGREGCRQCCAHADCPSGYCLGNGECASKECAQDTCEVVDAVICGQPAGGDQPCFCRARADGSGLFCAAFAAVHCGESDACPPGEVGLQFHQPQCFNVKLCGPQCDWPS